MKKYVMIFGVAYFILAALIAFLLSANSGGGSFNIAITIGASFLAASIFTKDHGRIPTPAEKSQYALGSLFASLLASAILVAAVAGNIFTRKELSSMKTLLQSPVFIAIILAAFLAVGTLYYFIIKWSFSWYANRAVA